MADDGHRGAKQKVLVAGGGIAGTELALALKDLAEGRVEVDIWDPRHEFVFKPFAVGEPYGTSRAFRYDMRRLGERGGALFHVGGITSVDTVRKLAVTSDGKRLSYDFLVVASGVRMLSAVPGAVTFWGAVDEGLVGRVIAELRAGVLRHVVFTMPAGYSWALPLYELALLAVTEAGRGGGGARVTVITPEEMPLEVFSRGAGERMAGMLVERGVEVVAATRPVKYAPGRLWIEPGGEIEADAVITLPRLEGRRIGGVPHDEDGFVGVDEHGAITGLDRAYAIGDVTAFPVKQGGLATQQADTVAEAIAAATGADVRPQPFDPILRGVLWTGGKTTARYLTPLVDTIEAEADTAAAVRAPSVP
jgi:sulfide:quinone oxidoreductase